MTWRQTVMAELREMGLSWGEAQASAKDRTLWRKIVVALCPTGDEAVTCLLELVSVERSLTPQPGQACITLGCIQFGYARVTRDCQSMRFQNVLSRRSSARRKIKSIAARFESKKAGLVPSTRSRTCRCETIVNATFLKHRLPKTRTLIWCDASNVEVGGRPGLVPKGNEEAVKLLE